MNVRKPPPPLEWHPWYRDKTWLLDWLENRGPYADLYDIRIPVLPPLRSWIFEPEPMVPEVSLREVVITRQRAAGPAPYVGRPFHYEWMVGVDNLGRCIADRLRRVALVITRR